MDADPKTLKATIEELERRLAEKDVAISALEQANKRLEERIKESESQGPGATSLTELEEMIQRLMVRTANILQGEKCVFMLYDEDDGELVAAKPAVGFSDPEIKAFRVPASHGIDPFYSHWRRNNGHPRRHRFQYLEPTSPALS